MARRKFDSADVKATAEILEQLATGAYLIGKATPSPRDDRIFEAIAAVLRAPDMPALILGVLAEADQAAAAKRLVSIGVAADSRS